MPLNLLVLHHSWSLINYFSSVYLTKDNMRMLNSMRDANFSVDLLNEVATHNLNINEIFSIFSFTAVPVYTISNNIMHN